MDNVTYIKITRGKSGQLKSQAVGSAAQRYGIEIESSKKFAAGSNKQHTRTRTLPSWMLIQKSWRCSRQIRGWSSHPAGQTNQAIHTEGTCYKNKREDAGV